MVTTFDWTSVPERVMPGMSQVAMPSESALTKKRTSMLRLSHDWHNPLGFEPKGPVRW
jgi:hypothetical protein